MLSTILMFVAAIGLSAVAGYYSVIGMTSIFAGAFVPIIIMTGILETSKIIVASWLYNNWNKTPFALKGYLSIAVVILMGITSMGIFGYLSKAHIEQAAAGQEQQAQLDHVVQQIATQTAIVTQTTAQLDNLTTQSGAQDTVINAKIADANRQIDNIIARIQPQIDEQQHIIDTATAAVESRVTNIQSQINDLDTQLANLDAIVKSLIDQKYATKAQKKQTEQKPLRDSIAAQKEQLSQQIITIRTAPNATIAAANAEITKLRTQIDTDTAKPKDVVNQLTDKLNQGVDLAKMQSNTDLLNAKIKTAQDEIAKLTADKYKLEGESRKLEVEVGPLKYIAEMLYGTSTDTTLLEKAVRGVIMVIIIVFDPLAVLMLIAANQGLAEYRTGKIVEVAPAAEVEPEPALPAVDPVADVMNQIMPTLAALRDEIDKLAAAMSKPNPTQPDVKPTMSFGDLSDDDHAEFLKMLTNEVKSMNASKSVHVEPRNHTISFDSSTNDLTILEETDNPVARLPVVEDDIDNTTPATVVSVDEKLEWQLIDKLPVKGTTTATDFLNRLQELYQRRLQTNVNNKTED